MRCFLLASLLCLCANSARGADVWTDIYAGQGKWTYVFDGEGEYSTHHGREWTQCWSETSPPRPNYYFIDEFTGVKDGLHYHFAGAGADWDAQTNGEPTGDFYLVRANIPLRTDVIHCSGYWTWNVSYTDGIQGRDVSYWGSVGALSETTNPRDPLGTFSVDAADAAVMFLYWGTPVADFTGDAMTDAADAGYMMEHWTGDTSPMSVPEPTSLWPLVLTLLLGRKRNNVVAHLNPVSRVGSGMTAAR